MSGLEVIAVIGAVAGVISAYKDASKIVQDFRDKRRAKKSEELEQSLAKAPLAVEEAKNYGIDRFGQAFEEGDQIAREALKDVLIALQSSLLKQLAPAAQGNDVVDFSVLVDISDIGRIESVGALWELHMRMATAASIKQQPQPRQGSIATVSSATTAKPPKRLRGLFQRRSSRTSNTVAHVSPQTSSNPASPTSPLGFQSLPSPGLENETNPWENVRSASDVQSVDTASTLTTSTSSTIFTLPSPTNDYGGFCKGAYYLQAGLYRDGAKLLNVSTAMTGESRSWWCRNSNCVFEGPARQIRKEYFFDDSVRQLGSIKYRWAFLAKCHVALKRTRKQIFHYRCIFCVMQGKDAPIIPKTHAFLMHVEQHRGQPIEELILLKTLCINDRVAADEEYFDINLPPLDKPSTVIADSIGSLSTSIHGVEEREHTALAAAPDPVEETFAEQKEVQQESDRGRPSISMAWSVIGDNTLDEDPWRDV